MPDVTPIAPAAVTPSSAASTSTSASTPSTSTPSSSPTRTTTADLASKLFDNKGPTQDTDLSVDETSGTPVVDSSWAEAYADGIHGVQVKDLLESLLQGKIPDALHDKIKFSLKDGDDVWEDTLAGMREGSMRRQNYQRKTQELAQERQQFYSERQEFVDNLYSLQSDPEMFLESMERLSMPVLKAAQLLAERLTQADAMNAQAPGSGDQWLEAQKAVSELKYMKRQQAAQEAKLQAQQQKQLAKARENKIQGIARGIFAEVGLKIEPASWNLANDYLKAIVADRPIPPGKKQAPLYEADIRKAITMAKERLDGYVSEYHAQKPPQKDPGSALSGVFPDAGAPRGVPQRAPKKPAQKTTAEAMAELREARGGFRQ